MGSHQLTPGAIAKLVAGETGAGPLAVQVLGIKRLQNGQGQQDRFRVLVSDGEFSHSCMLATQLGDLIQSNSLKENSIVTLHDFISNAVQNKNVVIVLNLSVTQVDAQRIGNPQQWDKVHGGATAAPAFQPAPAQQQPLGAAPPAYNAMGGYGGPPPVNQPGGYGVAPPNQGPSGAGYGQGAPGGGYNAGAPGGPYGGAPGGPAHPQQARTPGNPYGQPGQQYRGTGPVARNESHNIMPIKSLNSYQNRWTIKARVTNKSDIRRYSNARGEGKFFSFDLLDVEGGEIRVVCWNDQCDRWEPVVEQGKVYMISKASLRNKRGNFNQTRHQYEIHLENSSQVELCGEEEDIPHIFFNFTKIAAVEDTPPGNMLDVIGVVETVADWATITKKDGTETKKRSLTIRDDSGRSVELTLWGKYANEPGDHLFSAFTGNMRPVVAVKNARVGDFNGKTLSTVASSTVAVDPPDVPEAVQLRQWYDQGGAGMAVEALSRAGGGGRSDRRITLSQIKDEGLGMGEKPDWVVVSGAITYLRTENMFYPACSNKIAEGRQCNKKLQDNGDGTWTCERCAGNFEPEYRYMLSFQLADHTGEAWVTAFQEQGVEIMGRSAGEIKDMRESLGEGEFSSYMSDLHFRHFVMKLKVASETYQDEAKLRISAVTAAQPDFVAEGKTLLDMIAKIERGEQVFAPRAPAPAGHQQPPAGQQRYSGYGAGAGYGGGQAQQHGGAYKQQTPPPAHGGYGGGYGGGYQNQNQPQQHAGGGPVQDRFW